MKVKINKYYELEILRKGKWEKTLCPFMKDSSGRFKRCGCHCALFGEPESGKLELCNKTLNISNIIDERE